MQNTQTQRSALKQKSKPSKQVSPIKELFKLTAIAALSFVLFVLISFYIIFHQIVGVAFNLEIWFYIIAILVLFIAPAIFCHFLPWMENAGLGTFNRNNVLWAMLTTVIFFVLLVMTFYILMRIPHISPNDWAPRRIQRFANSYGGLDITGILMYFLTPLVWLAIAFMQYWCAFTLTQKLRGYVSKPYATKAGCLRASRLTRWSFILMQSAGVAVIVALYGLLIQTVDRVMSMAYYPGTSSSFFALDSLLLIFLIYAAVFLFFVIIFYSFTEKRFPIYMRKLSPNKLFASYGLVYIFVSVMNCITIFAVGFLMNTINLSQNSMPLMIGCLIAAILATVWMCKKIFVYDIQKTGLRILMALLIGVPFLWYAIELKQGSREDITFLLILVLSFFAIILTLFILSFSVKWALRIVYGKTTMPTNT